ncbi:MULTISPECIES: polysaccharide biosynthesis/export family protein [Paracoccaceae]|jgi:polysaccharide export outer membrane protein|uniref:polysaccharide biosynthesis/export family protein n=1 Tax=Rhodobacterales TaxID=204455 RepID=UPI001B0A7A51|nr:polysaccharide biosynthesis/export family protein [Boseongicola sp. H5]MBO6601627.1 polysaccharide export protein [Roseicyclus sp.]MBO6623459.1 polysaccharide export protein [Roseicyclus sp.]MBO6920795.1 polysaccharide export protein [Roseicyclus sp.]
MKRISRVGIVVLICLGLAACALPRGAPLEREILQGADDDAADFAVYAVTRDFLPTLAEWPLTGEPHRQWIAASAGSRGQVIAAGDALDLTIWDSNENSLLSTDEQRAVPLTNLRVAPNGTIFVPYVGSTQVAGMSPEVARESIQEALEAIVPSAQVQLSLSEGRGNSVDLVGGVNAPGSYPLPDRSFTVLGLIAQGGGVQPALANPQIRLVRAGRIYATSINRLYSEPQLDTRLRGGDQIIVEEDRRYFLSLGAAGLQAQHRFPQDVVTALDAMAIIGGVSAARADPQGVLILREYPVSALQAGTRGPRQQRVVFTLDLTTSDGLFSARNFRIAPGDLVLATESPVTAAQTIFGLFGSIVGLGNQAANISD